MKIYENFLEKNLFAEIQKIIFNSDFAWYYNKNTAFENDNSNFYFYHILFLENQIRSTFFNKILIPLISKIEMKQLIRAKLNCYTKQNKHIYTAFHKDFPDYHNVALFSINTNNGFTYFKNKTKINSKENVLLLFNGNMEHCSVNQTDENLRINININYI